jgi:hypothetical protein
MTAPTAKLRTGMYARDKHRCLDCGTTEGLTFQHRESSGMGGRGRKAPPLGYPDGITLCLICNQRCEAEGQERALQLGYKIRRNRGGFPSFRIPVFDRNEQLYFLLGLNGSRVPIHQSLALELLAASGNLGVVA